MKRRVVPTLSLFAVSLFVGAQGCGGDDDVEPLQGASGGGLGGGGQGMGGMGGQGGEGAAGPGPCGAMVSPFNVVEAVGDETCAEREGTGSRCVRGACTKALASCDRQTIVVYDDVFVVDAKVDRPDGDLPVGACYFREITPALNAVAIGTTTKVVTYSTGGRFSVPAPITVPAGVAFEGGKGVSKDTVPYHVLSFEAPVTGAPLVTLAAGSSLKGFAIVDNTSIDTPSTAKGVAANAGSVTLTGPLIVTGVTVSLELGGDAKATVTGNKAAFVQFDQVDSTGRGVVVGPGAGLTALGDGTFEGLRFDDVLIEAGNAASPPVSLEGVRIGGSPAVEINPNRLVALSSCVFSGRRGLTLNGGGTSAADAFAGVTLTGNNFAEGSFDDSVICGVDLGAVTTLRLGPGNLFALDEECAAIVPEDSCGSGELVGFTGGEGIALQCQDGAVLP